LRALEQALTSHTPEIHHSDQAVQYAATASTARLQAAGVQISMAEVGAAWQNGYAERLMRTIKEEEWTAPVRADTEEREVLQKCVIYC